MSWLNYDDVYGQITGAGLIIDPNVGLRVGTAAPVRCKIQGGDGEKRGWYRLFELATAEGSLITGSYGIWHADDAGTIKVELPRSERRAMSADQLAAIKARQAADEKRARAEQQRRAERAAEKAAAWWRRLTDAGEAPYLVRKGFAAGKLYGARVSARGSLVIPLQDTTGKTWGLQVIAAEKPKTGDKAGRDKDFTPPGLAKKGHFFQVGLVARGGLVLLCEGFATGASLHEATGLPVVVAFDAGNLLPVAQEIHKAHRRDVRILVCADDDYLTEAKTGKNTGRAAAEAAAIAVDGAATFPIFPGERPTDRKGPTDFNDLHVHPDGGLRMVAAQIEDAIRRAGWREGVRPRQSRAAEAAPGGGGERPQLGGARIRRAAAAVMPLDELVERFVPVDDGTGKYVFDSWTNKIAQREQMIQLLPAGVRGDDIKRHPLWVGRGAYFLDEVGFDPSGVDAAVKLNTWRGWPMVPKAGSCERLLELLHYLCSLEPNADEVYQWVLRWMAYPLQKPGAKLSSAIIMHGPQGTGKSTIWQCLAKIYGDYSTVLNQRGLEDRFNSDWVDSKLFMLAEEVVTRAEMWHIKNELKELITGEWIRVNPKNVAAYRQRNQVNVVFLSNENQPLPLENDDRRHCVIWTPPQLGEVFYDEVHREIEAGGIEAFYHYLLNLDLGDFHAKKRPPMTGAKRDLIDLSAPSETRFMREWSSGELGLPVCPARSSDVYAAYLRWCKHNGEARPRPSNQFLGAVDRMPGWEKDLQRIYKDGSFSGSSTPTRLVLPPENLLAPEHRYQEGTSRVAWLTKCAESFREAATGSLLKDA